MAREQNLNADAGDTIARLRAELAELEEAGAGQSEKVQKAAGEASQAAAVLHDRESQLAEITEDVARLAASHQSADRFFEDAQKRLSKAEAEEINAKAAVTEALKESERQLATGVSRPGTSRPMVGFSTTGLQLSTTSSQGPPAPGPGP